MSETRDGNVARRLLVVGAHSGDFVWRSAEAVAAATSGGGEAKVVALSYGERGESGDLWNEPGQTVENVKKMRHAQSEAAAAAIGAEFVCMDLGDYPLRVSEKVVDQLAGVIREFSPDVILTHTERDPFNPDHPVAHAAVLRARLLASGAGWRVPLRPSNRRSCSTSSRISRSSAASNRTRSWISPASSSASLRRWRRWRPRSTCTSTTPRGQSTAPSTRDTPRGTARSATPRHSSVRFRRW
jgi:LmbE family N-acetylglucosaminyl deacetylase